MAQMNTFDKRLAGMACATLLAGTLFAQTYVNKEWEKSAGLPDTLDWSASVFDVSGNIIMTGNTLAGPGNPDVLINKFDRNGELLWQRTFDGSAHGPDYGAAVTTDGSGNSYIAAAITSPGSMQDIAVLKYSTDGELIWSAAWDGLTHLIDAPSSIKLDASGNVYVAGITYVSLTNVDYVLIKFDQQGTMLWFNNYDHNGSIDLAVGLEFNSNNDPVVSGASAATPGLWDYATVSYNKINGGLIDAERVTVPGVSINSALAFTRDNAGHFYLTGYSEANGDRDVQTVRLSSAFTLDWASSYSGTTGLEDLAKAIDADDGGRVYVAGHSDLPEGGSMFLTIKYATNGDTLWTRNFRPKDPSWRAEANKLAVTEDGGVLVVGTVYNGDSYDFLTVKYDANGKMEWNKKYDGLNGDDKALSLITVGKDAYVSGITGDGPAKTYTVVKYRSTIVKDSAIVDTNGVPQCMDRQLIVKFRKPFVNTDWVDKKGIEFGTLDEAVTSSVADEVAHKLGVSSGGKIPVYKVFRDMTTADSISISRLGEEVRMPEFWRVLKIGLPEGTDLLAAIDSLNTLGHEIVYAQVNNIYQPYDIPNDPVLFDLHRQPSLVPTAEYPNADINVDPAWDIQTGIPEVKVGIVDHLISPGQADFGLGAESHIAGGYDFVLGGWGEWNEDVQPSTPHGSAAAGIVGAVRNNGLGIAGIAGGTGAANTGCSLYTVGIVDNSEQYLTLNDIAPAVTDAGTDIVGNVSEIPGCQILNASWGQGPSLYAFSPLLIEAVINTYHNQCVFVAARGQAASPGPYSSTFPSGYGGIFLDDNGVLCVGASGTDGLSMTFANGDYYTQYTNGRSKGTRMQFQRCKL